MGSPIIPVYRGEIQCLSLGVKIEVLDEVGNSLKQQKGELVCSNSFPSMPVSFLNDEENKKYHSSYFEKYPNIWCHGDFAEITEHGGMMIYGRSDTALNPGGVRIGAAEIYNQVNKIDEIHESCAISQDWGNDVRIVLFVSLKMNQILDEELISKIKKQIRNNTSPHHVPAKIVKVAEISKTINGKVVELAVRNVVHGFPVKNKGSMMNPEALMLFKDIPELQR